MSVRRVALVTGSGKRRVGSFVADALARRGYAIAVHYHTSEADARATAEALRQHGVEAEMFAADLRDEGAVKALIDNVLVRFGRLDVLVNCAAVWKRKPLEEVSAADVREREEDVGDPFEHLLHLLRSRPAHARPGAKDGTPATEEPERFAPEPASHPRRAQACPAPQISVERGGGSL